MTSGEISHTDNKMAGEEIVKRRKLSSAKQESDGSVADEFFMASPYIVNLGPGVRITTVAAGGRHTLALSGNPQCHGYDLQGSCFFFVVSPYSFVGCMKYEAMKIFDVNQDT